MRYLFGILFLLLVSSASYAQKGDEEEFITMDNTANGINNEGYEAMEQGDYELAKELFRQAIAIDSSAVPYYENLALACQRSDDQVGLLQCYQMAKKNIPDDPNIFYYSGDVLQNAGRYEEAIRDYDRAIELSDPEYTDLLHFFYFNRGNAYLKLKDFQTAVDNYSQALDVFPQHAASYANRGMARYNLKDKTGACTDWQQAYDNGYEPAANYQKKYCQ
ncbi:MAG: tetratricopeptide repeat protein [Bacteroidota bacterium]